MTGTHPHGREGGAGEAGADRAAARRAELGAFLRSRRSRLQPEEVRLARSGRRRTPGLRREEVARLAEISVAWYTWLEQGREIRVSAEVLQRVADALRLDADERRHLSVLAGPGADAGSPAPDAPTPRLSRVLEALRYVPAAVLGRYADVLEVSPALRALLPEGWDAGPERRNWLVVLFTDARLRARLSDWESVARECLAHFRVGYAARVGDPRSEAVVARLRRESPEFALWWERHELEPCPAGRVMLDHPDAGCLALDHVLLSASGAPGLTLGLAAPADRPTRERVARRVRAMERRAQGGPAERAPANPRGEIPQ